MNRSLVFRIVRESNLDFFLLPDMKMKATYETNQLEQ